MNNAKSALGTLVNLLLPSWQHVAALQSSTPDRPLPPGWRLGVTLHLLACDWCRRYGRQVRLLRAALQSDADSLNAGPPARLSPAARERMKAALRRAA